jgi:hypothetical protein
VGGLKKKLEDINKENPPKAHNIAGLVDDEQLVTTTMRSWPNKSDKASYNNCEQKLRHEDKNDRIGTRCVLYVACHYA